MVLNHDLVTLSKECVCVCVGGECDRKERALDWEESAYLSSNLLLLSGE